MWCLNIMDTFDGSMPNLISDRLLENIDSKLNNISTIDILPNQNKKMMNGVSFFYTNFVKPNLFFIIMIGILILFLVFRYIRKVDRDSKKKEKPKKKKEKQYVKEKKQINVNVESNVADMISDDYLIDDEPIMDKV